jgi:ribonuclease Z
VFPTKHSKGSVGFTVIEKRKKLKSEYKGLTGPQIVELKKQGIEIDYPLEFPIVTYLGDTQYVDFSQLKYIVDSKILIAECTFYEGEHTTRAKAGRHMHIDEFVTLLNNLNNEHIIITHTTQRTPMSEIRKILRKALPKDKYNRITLLMAAKSQGRIR